MICRSDITSSTKKIIYISEDFYRVIHTIESADLSLEKIHYRVTTSNIFHSFKLTFISKLFKLSLWPLFPFEFLEFKYLFICLNLDQNQWSQLWRNFVDEKIHKIQWALKLAHLEILKKNRNFLIHSSNTDENAFLNQNFVWPRSNFFSC